MNARWLGVITLGASLLLDAGSALADDGYAGDTGGPPPPEMTEPSSVVRSQPLSFRDGPSATYAGWAGDTGGPPPVAESAAAESSVPAPRVAAASSAVEFTDRG